MPLAKPNYSFEKRQREIAKKKKQDEKEARKREARNAARPAEPAAPESSEAADGSASTPAAAPTPAGPRIHRRTP